MPSPAEKEKWFQEGFCAHRDGFDKEDNPLPDLPGGDDWCQGWVYRDRLMARKRLRDRFIEPRGFNKIVQLQEGNY